MAIQILHNLASQYTSLVKALDGPMKDKNQVTHKLVESGLLWALQKNGMFQGTIISTALVASLKPRPRRVFNSTPIFSYCKR